MHIWQKYSSANKALRLGLILALLLIAAALFSLCAGASGASFFAGLRDAITGTDSAAARILIHIRLPRTAAAVMAGAALSCAGVIIQGVLDNPLAGPNVIGVNAGAGFTTLLAASLAFPAALLPAAAFAGALGAALIILLLSGPMGASKITVVLAGVTLSAIISAGTDLITTIDPEATLGMSTFMIGGFSGVTAIKLQTAACYIIPAIVIALITCGQLDILGLGDETARSLGMRVKLTRCIQLILAAVLAGAAVSFSGLLGFVGLIVPHAIRRIIGGAHRKLMPISIIAGALFVLICDTAARSAFGAYELPVGIILSLTGGPFFLALLIRSRRRWEQ